MIKLVRNTFGDKKIIVNGNGQKIRWDYVQKLYEKENCEGLRAATKLTNRHLHYYNEKMNVCLAAQLLSNSVCDELLYLNGSDTNFEGCLATAEFSLIFNNVFDILNSPKQLSIKPFNSSINGKAGLVGMILAIQNALEQGSSTFFCSGPHIIFQKSCGPHS